MKRILTVVSLAAALSVLAAPALAGAQEEGAHRAGYLLDRSPQERPQMLSFWAFAPWYYGVGIGVGARYNIPIVPNGFIPPVNDSFELEFGGDISVGNYFGYGWTNVSIPAEAMWRFFFLPNLSAYWKIALGLNMRFSSYSGYVGTGASLYWDSGLGVVWKFADKMTLRGEFGYTGPRVGLGILF